MIKAVLFDMDGVLADSEEFICEAAMKMFEEKGLIVKPEDFLPFVGAGEDRYLGGVAEAYNFELASIDEAKARTYAIYGEIIVGRLKELPGAAAFVGDCREKGLKTALATSADKDKMIYTMNEIGLSLDRFDACVNGLDLERKKPYPDIYLMAARLLGVDPRDCLVVEDAVNGVEAARAAGARCLALTSSFTREELSGADWFASDLSEVPADVLKW
ncbi:HAD family phosphatase [Oceanispirochaeta sp.]|jgi:beta-phosphoglucomutase|uniref:HAD family hydrolase n=1 Tax=Oceanispirochaeta sp. TaxID=2035350 RepID=UPI0026141887|nr:HAD-IA family hydrolase [Oceanispirochaeta sp.]MDA3958651.1 HAD-IA family hydrolase [Oceanispirochaeta sp.]